MRLPPKYPPLVGAWEPASLYLEQKLVRRRGWYDMIRVQAMSPERIDSLLLFYCN
jgi:hypothetical protein